MKQIKSIVRQFQNSFSFDCNLKVKTFAEYHYRAHDLIKGWLKKKKVKYPNFIAQLDTYIELSGAESVSHNNSKAPSDADPSSSGDENMGVTKNAARSKKTETTSSANPNLKALANKFAEDTKPGYLDLLKTDQDLTDAIDLLQNVIFFLNKISTISQGGKNSNSLRQKKLTRNSRPLNKFQKTMQDITTIHEDLNENEDDQYSAAKRIKMTSMNDLLALKVDSKITAD